MIDGRTGEKVKIKKGDRIYWKKENGVVRFTRGTRIAGKLAQTGLARNDNPKDDRFFISDAALPDGVINNLMSLLADCMDMKLRRIRDDEFNIVYEFC